MSTETLVTLEPEGIWPDTALEEEIFSGLPMRVEHLRYELGTAGEGSVMADIPDDVAQRVHGLYMFRHWLTAADIERFPNLRVVVRMGVGYDRLDRVALAKKRVTVCNVPDYGTTEVADHAITLALTLRRGVLLYHDAWLDATLPRYAHPIPSALVQRPSTRTFGILGLGRIGTCAALRAKAFGWRVVCFDPYIPNGVERALGIERVRTIEALFDAGDTISVHVPLSPETKNIVNEKLLRRMPAGGVLINTSRGGTVDLDGLEKVLRDGSLAGAGLDVIPQEPPDENDLHPLLQAYRNREDWLRGRLVVTPHLAYYSPEAWGDIRTGSAWTMRAVLCEGTQTNVIKPEDP